jgi:2'-5' RNA ligase
MVKLVALDVAILPPPDVTNRAIEYSAALSAGVASAFRRKTDGPHTLRLDGDHLPHVTLTQHFVREEELDLAFSHVDDVLTGQPPLRIVITGGGRSGHTLWMTVERTAELLDLHERLMEALRGVERQEGGPHAFFDENGRVRDVLWVTGFRLKAGSSAYTPHITLGHGDQPPAIEPFAFDATTIAACHLGRFCACRRVLRAWTLERV